MPFSSRWTLGLLASRAALASVTVGDPSDVIPASDWADDNAIVPDYNVPFLEYQPSDSESPSRVNIVSLYFIACCSAHSVITPGE